MPRLFLFLTTFGILNIIVGVIVENTLNAAKQNQELQDCLRQHPLLSFGLTGAEDAAAAKTGRPEQLATSVTCTEIHFCS